MHEYDLIIAPVISLLCIAIGLVVVINSPKSTAAKTVALISGSTGIWILAAFLSDLTKVPTYSLLLNRMVFVALSVLMVGLLYLPFVFPVEGKVNPTFKKILYIVTTIFGLGTLLTPFIVSGIQFESWGSNLIYGKYFMVFTVFAMGAMVISLVKFIFNYFKLGSEERKKIRPFFEGLFLFMLATVVVHVVVRNIVGSDEYYRFGNYSAIVFVGFTSYAIIKQQLFSIKVIVTELAVALIVIMLFVEIFTSRSVFEGSLRAVITLVASYGGFILIRSVRQEIQHRKEVEKLVGERTAALGEVEERNRNLATLQKISEVVLNESDMRIMAQKILDELPQQLEACAGAFLSIVRDGNLVAYAISSNEFSRKILSMVGGDLEKYSFPIKRDFNLLHQVLVKKKSISSENLADFISPPIDKPLAMTMQKIIGACEMEAFPLYAGGEPFGTLMFIYHHPVREKNYGVARAISDDMSLAIQRAQAFQKLKEANEYLAQLDKMKDEFISMASHELNTPLAAIEGYLSMVLDEGMGKVDKQSREYLSRAYSSSKRLAELILDLLNVSRIEQGRLKMKFAKVMLTDLANSVIQELQIKADAKKLYLKLDKAAKSPETWCDPDRIRGVIVNLVGNALKFTERGGITIKIGAEDGKVRCEVVDTGRGISEEGQKKLFQKFSQVKRQEDEQVGTGLGLYISKNFIELHKGRIWVESEEGKGATFGFEIPMLKAPPKVVEGAMLEGLIPKEQAATPAAEAGHQVPKLNG